MIGVRRYAHLSRKIVCCSQRNDAEGHVVPIQTVHHFVDGSVSACRGYHVHAATRGVGGEGRGLAGFERRVGFNEMTLGADPADEMTDVVAAGAAAMDDERDMFACHADR